MALTRQPWTSVSKGVSTPGAPVTALPWDDVYELFITDPHGGIYAFKAVPGYGWEAVPGLTSKPGTPITFMTGAGLRGPVSPAMPHLRRYGRNGANNRRFLE